ncbi:hypothetical protein LZ30DRAFT_738341 [Colletotrichum cereale]|nr:hypothetical protein LZ30DRAFT_738341 [Colletotrichum cereale]
MGHGTLPSPGPPPACIDRVLGRDTPLYGVSVIVGDVPFPAPLPTQPSRAGRMPAFMLAFVLNMQVLPGFPFSFSHPPPFAC